MADSLESKIEGIRFTERAAKKALELAKADNIEGYAIRVKVKGGGCAGFSYDMHFEDKKLKNDKELEFYGLKVYVDPFSLQYIEGTEIDYEETLTNSGFRFKNPKVKASCGCGSSFTVE